MLTLDTLSVIYKHVDVAGKYAMVRTCSQWYRAWLKYLSNNRVLLDRAREYHAREGNLAALTKMCKMVPHPDTHAYFCMMWSACACGRSDIVEYLLTFDCFANRSEYVRAAASHGYYQVLKLLLGKCGPMEARFYINYALEIAAGESQLDIVREMLACYNVANKFINSAFRLACFNCKPAILKLFLQHVNPNDYVSFVGRSLINTKPEIIALLLADPRFDPNVFVDSITPAICASNVEIVIMLVTDPRLNISHENRMQFREQAVLALEWNIVSALDNWMQLSPKNK